MMKREMASALSRWGEFSNLGSEAYLDPKAASPGLWHSNLVHIEDILNVDDYVDENAAEEGFCEKIHCVM